MKKVISSIFCFIFMCTLLPFSVFADNYEYDEIELYEEFVSTESDISDENLNIISRIVENSTLRTTYSLNWTIPANSSKNDTTKFSLSNGDYMYYNLSYTPVSSNETVKIGVFRTVDNVFRSVSVSSGSYNGFISINNPAIYVLRISNLTSNDITITGTFESVQFIGSMGNLQIPLCAQENSNWCWAACIQMCANYLGYSPTQTAIVTAAKGSPVNMGGNASDYKKGMEYATNNQYTATRNENTLSVSSLKDYLSNANPVIISFAYYNNSGQLYAWHANVLTAVDQNNKYIRTNDPANNGTIKVFKYSSITDSSATKKYQATTTISLK